MKTIKKVLLRMIIIFLVITTAIFILRAYNDYKYKSTTPLSIPKYYENVTDTSLYPSEIEGVDLTYIDNGAMQGFRLTPKEKVYKGVVICYGGSEGAPNFEEATRLAKQGYETFALFFFGMKNQPTSLTKVPLEQFEEVITYVKENIEDNQPISVLGASKGAEYALNLASKYQEIDNLILIAPSAYNFAGLDFDDYGSSWTYEGRELPYIDIKSGTFGSYIRTLILPSIAKTPIAYKDIYKVAVENDPSSHSKLVDLKNVKANILMIVGEEDMMWDSLSMANEIKSQNANAQLYSFKGAGHIFSNDGVINLGNRRISTGGRLEDNQKARDESRKIIDGFLKEKHSK